MESRLDNLLGILHQCEELTILLHGKYFGPIASKDNKIAEGPIGLNGRLMEAINRASRVAEGLQAFSQELA